MDSAISRGTHGFRQGLCCHGPHQPPLLCALRRKRENTAEETRGDGSTEDATAEETRSPSAAEGSTGAEDAVGSVSLAPASGKSGHCGIDGGEWRGQPVAEGWGATGEKDAGRVEQEIRRRRTLGRQRLWWIRLAADLAGGGWGAAAAAVGEGTGSGRRCHRAREERGRASAAERRR